MADIVKVRRKDGKTYVFKKLHRKCLRCSARFNTIWTKKLYCTHKCYMAGLMERTRAWEKTEEGRVWRKVYRVDMERKIRTAVVHKLGRVCKKCGYSDARALQIDHVHGDGIKERDKRKTVYARIMRGEVDVSRYQLLCANCNWIKRWENNEGSNYEDYNEYLKTMPMR